MYIPTYPNNFSIFKKGILTSDDTTKQDKLILLTPTKTYIKTKSDVVDVVLPSPSSITSTPQKKKISRLIEMPSPNLKRKILDNFDDSPRKIKLKQNIKQKSKIIHDKNSHISKLKMSNSKFKIRNNLNNLIYTHKFSSVNSKTLVIMQLKKNNNDFYLKNRIFVDITHFLSILAHTNENYRIVKKNY